MSGYHTRPQNQQETTTKSTTISARPERRGVSRQTVIEAAKELVTVAELANHLAAGSRWRRTGAEWVTRCPLPDHQDRTASFCVEPEKGVWWCHGCIRGGDVIELARYAWQYDKDEVAMCAADLLRTFGHDVPARPNRRHEKEERQAAARNAVAQTRKNIWRRRLFERLILPDIHVITDEAERNRELRRAWEDFQRLLP